MNLRDKSCVLLQPGYHPLASVSSAYAKAVLFRKP